MFTNPKPSKSQIVQFSKLDQNNKTQFLQFLIKNNITFQQGKQNYTAKVTIKNSIKDLKNSTPLREKSRSNSVNIRQNINCKQKNNKQRKELASNQKKALTNNNIQLKNNSRSQIKQALKTPQKIKKKSQFTPKQKQNCTPKQSKINIQNKKTDNIKLSINLNKQSGKKVSLTNRQKSPRYEDKSLKKQINNESSPFIKSLKNNINTKVDNFLTLQSQQRNIGMSSANYKKKQFDRSQLVSKYINYFSNNSISIKQRPIRWSISQLQKQIQQIYDECFTKNTHMLNNNSRKLTQTISSKPNLFALLIESILKKKFKCIKLVEYNLTNILYSISYYTLKGVAPLQIKIFQQFLTRHYQFQDFMFFLFARNILIKHFKKSFDKEGKNQNMNYNSLKSNQHVMNRNQISKFVKFIVGKNSQILNEYQKIIFDKVQTNQIELDRLLSVLLEDYKTKRISAINNDSQSNSVNEFMQQHSLDNAFNDMYIGQARKSVQELTFGEDTKQILEINKFWKCQDGLFHQLDEFNEMIAQKLLQKTKELIQILANGSLAQQQIQKIQECLYRKCLGLFMTVVEMNKLKWLKQLHIQDAKKQDIQKVEQIQLYFRKIKNEPTAKDIAQFCKMILTLEQITERLSLFFIQA